LFYSLKPSFLFFKVSVLRLADTRQQPPAASSAAAKLANSQPTISSFSKSFIHSGKKGGGTTVLREGHDIVTGETCDHYSLNINILGKAAMLHLALALFCS
jgi:hypothetical protein